jgi:hypothetical protein
MLDNAVANNRYLDLLKRCLANCIYDEHKLVPVSPQGLMTPDQLPMLAAHGIRLAKGIRRDS